MKSADINLLRSCHRAVVTAQVGDEVYTIRIRPSELEGEKIILAIMIDPQHALEFTEIRPQLGLNPTLTLMENLAEPPAAIKRELVSQFEEIGMVFISPADQRAAVNNPAQ